MTRWQNNSALNAPPTARSQQHAAPDLRAPQHSSHRRHQTHRGWRNEGVDYDFATRDWTGENLMFELKAHPPLTTPRAFSKVGSHPDPSTVLAVRELDPRPRRNHPRSLCRLAANHVHRPIDEQHWPRHCPRQYARPPAHSGKCHAPRHHLRHAGFPRNHQSPTCHLRPHPH